MVLTPKVGFSLWLPPTSTPPSICNPVPLSGAPTTRLGRHHSGPPCQPHLLAPLSPSALLAARCPHPLQNFPGSPVLAFPVSFEPQPFPTALSAWRACGPGVAAHTCSSSLLAPHGCVLVSRGSGRPSAELGPPHRMVGAKGPNPFPGRRQTARPLNVSSARSLSN